LWGGGCWGGIAANFDEERSGEGGGEEKKGKAIIIISHFKEGGKRVDLSPLIDSACELEGRVCKGEGEGRVPNFYSFRRWGKEEKERCCSSATTVKGNKGKGEERTSCFAGGGLF